MKVKEKKKERPGIWDGDCQECKDTGRLVSTFSYSPHLGCIIIKLLYKRRARVPR